MTEKSKPEISVCVCTYKRPAMLLKLLESLAKQTFPLEKFEVIVVDNDKSASASHAILQTAQRYPALSVSYEIESTQGIAYARNRTVELAIGSLLAFIDDDELAICSWLSDMVESIRKFEVHAVLGPVIPQYSEGTRAWVIKSGFFERPRFATGTYIRSGICRTGNALVKACLVKSRQPSPFDARFAESGGEDVDLFRWLENQGSKFVWCDKAEVCEVVPIARQNLGYMLERGLRVSVTYWQEVNCKRSKVSAFLEAMFGFGIGVIFAVWGLCVFPAGLHRTARSWVISAKGFGRVIALTDYRLAGYR